MNVKAIMCDIDGTLLSSDGVVTPKIAGLIEILKLHHIDLKEIVTFGDADNDYDMTLNAVLVSLWLMGVIKQKVWLIILLMIMIMMVLEIILKNLF